MMIDELLEDVRGLAIEEMNRANLIHPPFHSRHEGVAVIEEEVRECEAEMTAVKDIHEWVKTWVFVDEITKADKAIERLEDRANQLAAEAIQVAAMCKKWRRSFVSEVSCKENDS